MNPSLHPLDNKLLLGRYRVVRLLGEGGMGTVHLARVEGAEGFTRPVVVKRMKRDMRISEEGNRLFIREAKILSKMQHPGIVGISDFGVEDGAHIMVLEYVHGYTLAPWLEYRQQCHLPLPVDVCLFIVRRILDALQYAHGFGTELGQEIEIVHRDISPDNVLLSHKGYVHLLDFGIASVRGPQALGGTNSGVFRGKLCYAAPELVEGKQATPRSDQYSAAILLLELLTGIRPFETDSIAESFVQMVNLMPDPPSKSRGDIPAGLDEALLRALAKQPDQRFESALAFSRELRRFQQEDDEEVAQHLKRLVAEDFELLPGVTDVESLKTREAALERLLSRAPTNDIQTLPNFPQKASEATLQATDLAKATTMAGHAGRGSEATGARAQRQLQGLLLGLLIVGCLIAVGVGGAVALLSRGHGAEQVVVVGGERSDLGASAPAPVAPAAGTHGAGQSETIHGAEPPLPAVSRARPTSVTRDAPRPAAASSSGAANLAAAVAQKSGAFQACFASNLNGAQQAPPATLHFSVAKQGGAAQVDVEPRAVAGTPLGKCLASAGALVRFPALSEPVAFRVPVHARVTRRKE